VAIGYSQLLHMAKKKVTYEAALQGAIEQIRSLKWSVLTTSALDGARFVFSPRLHEAYGLPTEPAGLDVSGLLSCLCDWVNRSGSERDRTSGLMRAAVAGAPDLVSPSDQHLSEVRDQLETTVGWSLQLQRSVDGPVLVHVASIARDEAFFALLTVLLMHRQYRSLLRICPAPCGELFMREGKRVFCSPGCATAANDAGLAERQRRRRLRLAALELLPVLASSAQRADLIKTAFKLHPEVTTPQQLAEHAMAILKRSRRKAK